MRSVVSWRWCCKLLVICIGRKFIIWFIGCLLVELCGGVLVGYGFVMFFG